MGRTWHAIAALGTAYAAALAVAVASPEPEGDVTYLSRLASSPWQSDGDTYHHVWPPMRFGWRIVLGSFIGIIGAAFGSVGGVGGGGIFVPMLMLIIGFDPKSAAAM